MLLDGKLTTCMYILSKGRTVHIWMPHTNQVNEYQQQLHTLRLRVEQLQAQQPNVAAQGPPQPADAAQGPP